MTNSIAKRRAPFWAIAVIVAGSAAGAATTLAAVWSPKAAPVIPVAALAPPADLDYAYRAFDAFRDQPHGPAAASTAALSPHDTRL
jgi:hypothetical protein